MGLGVVLRDGSAAVGRSNEDVEAFVDAELGDRTDGVDALDRSEALLIRRSFFNRARLVSPGEIGEGDINAC